MFSSLGFPWKRSKKTKIVPPKKVILGICAMDKKVKAKPMVEILTRLPEDLFEIKCFGDDCILNQPVESWPVVEVLITFYSNKFPTDKALNYIKLRKPYLINDLEMANVLKDRRMIYEILESIGIDVPFHVYVDREPGKEDTNFIEEFDEVLFQRFILFKLHSIFIHFSILLPMGSKLTSRLLKNLMMLKIIIFTSIIP